MSPYKAQVKTLKKVPRTNRHEFALVLDGVIEITAKIENALFEAGCDDATLCMRNGRAFLVFSREASSLTDAILSAIRDVARSDIGARVLRVDESQLVTQADIARRLGWSRQLVHQYVTGARGPKCFPPPVGQLTPRVLLWYWSDVARWLKTHELADGPTIREAWQIGLINNDLERRYLQRLAPEEAETLLHQLKAAQECQRHCG